VALTTDSSVLGIARRRFRVLHVCLVVVLLVILGWGSLSQAQQSLEAWTNAGSLLAARASHTATLLNDGTILIAGGEDGPGILSSAEIFDPVSGTSQPTKGPMTTARENHTALLLNDGRVLIVGGQNTTGVLASAEVYDAKTGTFASVGSMSQARRFHTATLLNDATVIVTGGESASGQDLTSIERFDPQSGLFTLLPAQLDVPRAQHTATLMQDGRILIVGGRTRQTALASTVYFDPVANTVSAGLPLAEARYAHTATQVLWGNVVFAGGTSDGKTGIDLVELLDVQGHRMGFAQNRLSVARWNHAAIIPQNNGNLILIGGQNGKGPVAATDILDPESFLSAQLPNLLTPSGGLGAFQGGKGRVCVAGGKGPNGPLKSVETSRHATVISDRTDYAPNTVVTLTGTGWAAGESVTLTISVSNGNPTTVWTATADANGNISNSSFETDDADKHRAFLVKAVGGTSKRTAYTRFTDLGATISLSPASFDVSPTPVTVQVTGSGFSQGSNEVCFYQPTTNALLYCTGYSNSQVTMVSDTDLSVTVPTQIISTPGTYNVQVLQQYYVSQECSYEYCYDCGWDTCCEPEYYNCSYYTTFTTGYAQLTVTQIPTMLNGPILGVVANYGDTISISAELTDTNSNPISGETIQFTLPGSVSGSGVTNSSGVATASISLGTLAAGSYPGGIQISFAGDNTYGPSSSTSNLTVRQLTPTLTWNTPSPIVYGMQLSSAQLDATATGLGGAPLPGAFNYSPGPGSLLPAGIATLSVTFTPTDTTDYTTASQTVNLVVNQAVPMLSWAAPSAISYGTPLGATQLDAAAFGVGGVTLPGTFVYTPAAGTVPNGGTQTLSVVFTPNDTNDYTTATAAVPLTVNTGVTSTVLNLSATTANSGTAVTLTAAVSSAGSPVTLGLITFCDGSASSCLGSGVLATAALTSAGTATSNLILGPGSHSVYAVFAGTGNYAASNSTPQTLTVSGSNSSATQIAASGSAGNYTLTATVTGNGTATPTGTVSFVDTSDSNLSLGTAALASGTTTIGFLPASTVAAGNGPSGVAAGDFNNDGKPDLAITNTTDNTVTILLGNGDGTFTAAAALSTGNTPSGIVVGQFTSNGQEDLAIVNSSDNTVTILMGNGNGTFTPTAAAPATGVSPHAIAVGDFNGDGILDLAVANASDNTVTILLGNGDGTFTAASTTASTGTNPSSVAVADFNGDGRLDLAVTDANANMVTVLLGNGDGTFTAGTPLTTGNAPSAILIGDFNGDGKADLALTNSADATVQVWLGNGDGTFTAATNTAATGVNPQALSIADFNGDGKQDVAVANFGDSTVSVLLGNGDGTFTSAATPSVGSGPSGMVALDFMGNGKPDVATANNGGKSASVLLGNPTTVTTATASGISAWGGGTQNAEASYPGDTNYSASSSGLTALTGTTITNTVTLSISPSTNVSFGQSIQFTVTVSPNSTDNYTAGGTVTLYDGSTVVGTATLSAGQAAITVNSLTAGSHNLTVSYAGDGNFAASQSSPVVLTISPASPTLTWNAPTGISYGTSLGAAQLDATAKGAGGSSLPGIFSYTPAAGAILGVGTQTLSVKFTPTDATDYTSATSTVSLVVSQGSALIALASSANTQLFGNSVTFTATVAPAGPGAATPTGTVTFMDGTTVLSTPVALNAGAASYSTSGLAVGSHAITAVYSGDANNLARTSVALTEVVQENVTIVLASGGSPSMAGAAVLFTANVTGSGGGTATGSITFKDGASMLGTGTLNGTGLATLSASTLAPGQHSITAVYGGDALNLPSTSGTLTQTVQENTTTMLTSSANPAVVGAPVALNVKVTAAVSGIPTGGVTFRDGSTTLGSSTLNGSGMATLSTTGLAAGLQSIVAVYGGDAINLSSSSAALSEQIMESTGVTVTANVNTLYAGSSVTFTATVSVPGGATPTGTVTFKDGGNTLGSGALMGAGTATYSTATLAVGTHVITAVYGGNSNDAGSTSSAMSVIVNPPNFTLTATPSSQTITDGQAAEFSLTVTPQGSLTTPVNFVCGGLPEMTTCSFSPASVTPDTDTVTTTLTIKTVGNGTASELPLVPGFGHRTVDSYSVRALAVLFMALLATLLGGGEMTRRLKTVIPACVLLAVLLLLAACAGNGGKTSISSRSSTPVGTTKLTVTATSTAAGGTVNHSTTLTLTIQ
jgi:Bacterial Ig-like domain (group 3)/FG-GAP-like repeat/Galactose oxidase, central domain